MGDSLHLDRAERQAAVMAALAALEQLRDLREINVNHTPADSELIDLAHSALDVVTAVTFGKETVA